MTASVVLVSEELTLGGTEKGLVVHALRLDRARFSPRVVCREGLGPRTRVLAEAGIDTSSADGDGDRLRSLLAGADIVHVWRTGTGGRTAVAAARDAGASFVVETDVFALLDPGAPGVDCRLFLSKTCAARYRAAAQIPLDDFHRRHRVLPLPLDHEALRAAAPSRDEARRRLGLDPTRPVVGRIGRNDDFKWRNLLVDMLPELLRRAPEAQILLVGVTERKRRRLERRGVLDRCLVVQPVASEEELATLYSACDVFVTAAELGESQGLAIAEAMAFGIPVVTCATPWVDNAQVELVDHGRTGYLASHPRPFAEAVSELIEDDALRERLGSEARAATTRTLDAGTLTHRLERLYEGLLENGAPPPEWEPDAQELRTFEAGEPATAEYRRLGRLERAAVRSARERERMRRVSGLLRPRMLPLAWSMVRARVGRRRIATGASPVRGGARMARIFAALLSADVATRVLAAVATVVVVRSLAPAAFADVAYSLAAAAVIGVLVDLGLSLLLVRDVSEDHDAAPDLLGGVLRAELALGTVVFGGAAVLALAGVIPGPAGGGAFALGLAVMAVNALIRPFESTLTAFGRASLVTLANVVRGSALVAGTVVIAVTAPGPAAFLAAAVAAEAIGLATIGGLCWARVCRPHLSVPWADVATVLRRAVPFALLAGFGLLYLRIDTIMLGLIGSDEAVGNYGVAARVLDTAIAVPAFFGGAFLATVAQTGAGSARAASQTGRALRYILLLCVPLAFALALTADPVVSLVAGSDYDDAAGVLARLSPVLALMAAYAVLANLQVALDHTGVLVRISVAGVAIKLALNAWAIPRYGANGAAVAAVGGEAFVVVAQWWTARSAFEARALLLWCVRLALCAAAMVAVGVLATGVLPWTVALAAGLAAFFLSAWLMDCLSPRDLRLAWTSASASTP